MPYALWCYGYGVYDVFICSYIVIVTRRESRLFAFIFTERYSIVYSKSTYRRLQ